MRERSPCLEFASRAEHVGNAGADCRLRSPCATSIVAARRESSNKALRGCSPARPDKQPIPAGMAGMWRRCRTHHGATTDETQPDRSKWNAGPSPAPSRSREAPGRRPTSSPPRSATGARERRVRSLCPLWRERRERRRDGNSARPRSSAAAPAGAAAALPPGAARNALDCALWDLEAKIAGVPAHELAGIDPPLRRPPSPSALARLKAWRRRRAAADRPILKVKLGGGADDRIAADCAPYAGPRPIMLDANEGWTPTTSPARCCVPPKRRRGHRAAACRPGRRDPADLPHPIPICADESVHRLHGLERLPGRYDAVNIKLDKTGGLTEALELSKAARALGFEVMVGCMVGTSLAMAPAMLLTQDAEYVDLDGPLILAHDRSPACAIQAARRSRQSGNCGGEECGRQRDAARIFLGA